MIPSAWRNTVIAYCGFRCTWAATSATEMSRAYSSEMNAAIAPAAPGPDASGRASACIVHGSEAVQGNRLRRTIYYEFRSARQIAAEGPWDAEWVDRRLRLVPVALRERARREPAEEPFAWNVPAEIAPLASEDDEAELRIAHGVHSPGSYCSAGNVPF